MARIGYSTGSLSLFEIARQSYALIPDDHEETPTFKDWCAHLWKWKERLYVLEFVDFPLDTRLAGIAIAFPIDDVTMRVDWLICRHTAVFMIFIEMAKVVHPGLQFLEFERITNKTIRRYRVSRLEHLLKKQYGTRHSEH